MEVGAASTVLAIAEHGGVPLAKTQKDLTPLQRMVILKEAERQQEEAEQQQGGQTPGSGIKNNAVGAGNAVQGDTTTYVNEGT